MTNIEIYPAPIDVDNSTGTYVGLFGPTQLPIGKFKCPLHNLPGYFHLKGDTILYPEPTTYALNFPDAYQVTIRGMKFIKGYGAIKFSNNNINGANILIEGCEFHQQEEYSIFGPNFPLSTRLTIRNCKIFGHKLISVGCDQTLIENCWLQLNSRKTEAIQNMYGNLYIKNCIFVPDNSHQESYWIYNKANVFIDQCRFGGEYGGIPIIKHDALADTKYPYMGPVISATNSQLSCGKNANPNRGFITIMKHKPRLLNIQNNHYLVDNKFINNKSTLQSPSTCLTVIKDNAMWGMS